MNRIALQYVLMVVLALGLQACDRKSGSGAAPPPGAKPEHLTGKLSDAQGKPLSNVTIRVLGFNEKGEPVKREVRVRGTAGEYDMELPNGMYDTPVARIGLEYHDRWYDLPLAAADGSREWTEQHDSRQGMVRDFVLKIAGRAPSGDANGPSGYWGGTIQFDMGSAVGEIATIEIALTPDGPLLDGSEGKPLNFTRKLPWRRREDHFLLDVPIGKYTATARILFGSKPKPLRLASYTIDPTNPEIPSPDKLPTKVPVVFECQEVKTGEWKLLLPNLIAFPPL